MTSPDPESSDRGNSGLTGARDHFSPVILAVVGLIVVLTSAFALHAFTAWRARLEQEVVEVSLLNQLVAQATQATFDRISGNAQVVGDRLLELHGRDDHAAIARVMDGFLKATPGVKRAVVVTPDGKRLYQHAGVGVAPGPDPVGPSARPDIARTYDEAARQTGLYIGRSLRNPAGQLVVPVRLPVRDAEGKVRLFIGVGLSADEGDFFMSRVSLPEGYAMRLVRLDGYLQAASPLPDKQSGDVFAEPVAATLRARLAALAPEETRTFVDFPGIDGQRRVGAYQRLKGFDLVSLISVPRSHVWAAWAREMRFTAAWYLAFLLGGSLVAVLGTRAQRRVGRERAAETERLRQNEALLRVALESARMGVWSRNVGSPQIELGENVASTFGLPPERAPRNAEQLLALVHPEDRKRVAQGFRRGDVSGDAVDGEMRIVLPDGGLRWVEIHGRTYVDSAGAPRRVGTVRDITERKSVEAQLRDAQRRLVSMFENTSDLMAVYRVEGDRLVIEQWNPALRRFYESQFTGIRPDGWIERPIDEFLREAAGLSAAAIEERLAPFRRVASTGQIARYQSQIESPNGSQYRDALIVPLADDAGRVTRIFYRGADITELVKKERALQQINASLEQNVAERTIELAAANRELEAFSYSIAHDLRSPLRAINGFSSMLKEDHAAELGPEPLKLLDRITGATTKASEMIDALLRLARLSRAEMHRRPANLSALASDVLDRLRAAQPERAVATLVAPDLRAEGDPALLETLLENLLSNAWKFTAGRPGAQIEVGELAGAADGGAYFVRDNGAGFDMRYADKLFGVFQRLHSGSEFSGTGVGLSIVRRIVERHGGRIWAEAEPGVGATFYFTLNAS